MPALFWPEGPARPECPGPGDVHVWASNVDHVVDDAILSVRERQRADAFVFDHDARRYRATKVMQRQILGAYTGVPPEQLTFGSEVREKPTIAPGQGPPALTFNLSGSGGLALIAIAFSRSIGVDLETPRDDIETLGIAERYFHPLEIEAIKAETDSALRRQTFYRCWTRKEAYMKALGEGLYLPMESFAVELAPVSRPSLLDCAEGLAEAQEWTLIDLSVQATFFGAVAVRGPVETVTTWMWP